MPFLRILIATIYLCVPIFSYGEVPKQVDIDRAKHVFDDKGVPTLIVEDLGQISNPAFVGLYALAYSGISYEEKFEGLTDDKKFFACVQWLGDNLVQNKQGYWVWEYRFDHMYNDVRLKAPWYSAFAQAVGIESFIEAYKKTKNKKYLELAEKAAQVLLTPLSSGGMLFKQGENIWFEEICVPVQNPPHILNGHMRALISLHKLSMISGRKDIKEVFQKGLDTLIKWLPKYDTGYWLRYDLNPKKEDLMFRFNNPFGYHLPNLAIRSITLKDPLSKKEAHIFVGSEKDGNGSQRIAGKGWGMPSVVDGINARRLTPVLPDSYEGQLDGSVYHTPETFFYLSLPNNFSDNLRSDWLEMTVVYKDEKAGNVSVQMRSIAPGPAFQWLRDGDLHLTGSGQWREWKIPIRVSDLGYYCGELYGKKHLDYLTYLSQIDERLKPWEELSRGYLNILTNNGKYQKVSLKKQVLPFQTTPLPLCLSDERGVMKQYFSTSETKLTNGIWDLKSAVGPGRYNSYIIASQCLGDLSVFLTPEKFNHIYDINPQLQKMFSRDVFEEKARGFQPENGYQYLIENIHLDADTGGAIWTNEFENNYNDVEIPAGWSSSFSQSYVIKAFDQAVKEQRKNPKANYGDLLRAAVLGYQIDISRNGFLTRTHYGLPFFEEFSKSPKSQINAQLVSLASLGEYLTYVPEIKPLYEAAIQALKSHLNIFDNGYWLRYDLNPKKELTCQIDWIEGEKSPIISSISVENPQTLEYTSLDAADNSNFQNKYPDFAGSEWMELQKDEEKGFGFLNGYSLRSKPVPKGALHNVYFTLALPTRTFENGFTVPSFKVKIRYKDIAVGRFMLKLKPIALSDFESFVPFRESQLVCIGDGQWKTATIILTPRDLGWFVGPDYQKFHYEQLKILADQRSDWYFAQMAERHKYFYDCIVDHELPIIKTVSAAPIMLENGVSVVESSKTYPEHSFEEARLKDESSYYIAGLEGEEHFVVYEFEDPYQLSKLHFIWESDANYPKRLKITGFDQRGKEVFSQESFSEVRLKNDQVALIDCPDVSRIRLDFSDFAGQDRLLMRSVKFEVSKSDKTTPNKHKEKYYLGPKDLLNPVSVFRCAIPQSIKKLSDELCKDSQTDDERILSFLKYISSFKVGYPSDSRLETLVREKIGSCGSYTNLFLSLCVCQGIKGRIYTLANYPKDGGHVVAEVLVDGKYRLYDPTFAGYYILKNDLKKVPLSYLEIIENYRKNPNSIEFIYNFHRNGVDQFTGKEIFLNANPQGIIGVENPMLYPIYLDLIEKPLIGKEDANSVKNQGAHYLGAASMNNNLSIKLTNLRPGKKHLFSLNIEGVLGERLLKEEGFKFKASLIDGDHRIEKNAFVSSALKSPELFDLEFIPRQESVTLLLEHPYRGPDFHYIAISQYSLKCLEK